MAGLVEVAAGIKTGDRTLKCHHFVAKKISSLGNKNN